MFSLKINYFFPQQQTVFTYILQLTLPHPPFWRVFLALLGRPNHPHFYKPEKIIFFKFGHQTYL
ncbi:MAG: hypothetical protein CL527_10855 [Aequorivita sp.]|uniref:Uncharacterized protein n=1 Tax=Aequorivita vladivostokensis TaxID=171194 RepID=A0ABR5DJ34_9FLAO|nr:hypothetical protein MB09_08890 [Aequorivita vladivostokensis]MAB57572.1 hypothetical protein [Aequorivita sp.]MAO49165.1 hypothetical protein [Aequorivita sp.]HAV54104.1 hypothetical protein [Aequorivita sp.]HBL80358.1 hypothetical protein [Aequorivita sp.]